MSGLPYTFTSESVSEGHPDKVCDFIADSVLDACLEKDKNSRVACEVLCKENLVVVAGEIRCAERIDHEFIVRNAIRKIGYVYPNEPFHADTVQVLIAVTPQSTEIGTAVDGRRRDAETQGAGDQGIMFGYASDETPELMPLPIMLAHGLTKGLSEDRHAGVVSWLRADAKAQVSVLYEDDAPKAVTHVLVSTQHASGVSSQEIHEYVASRLAPRVLGDWFRSETEWIVNPSGSFVHGGPSADCGVTGRKIIVDSYGGMGRHGGGAFSGKDPSKVDRSGAYFCRYVARQVLTAGLAKRAEIQVSYAIGRAKPLSVKVDTFGTGDDARAVHFVEAFDFRPAAIVEQFDLLRPIYRQTTNYGHFGKHGLPWEDGRGQ
jgi:S-adenosylmethionine synthetase